MMRKAGICIMLIAMLAPYICFARAESAADSQAAKKSKVVLVDRNKDGIVDGIDVYNDDGKVVRRDYDDNNDGVMDRWRTYDPNTGMPNVVESDTYGELR